MANERIDVKAEAERIAEWVRAGSTVTPIGRPVHDVVSMIESLASRVRDEASREAMERAVDAVMDHSCNDPPECCGSSHYVAEIRQAFAEPGKEQGT